MSIIRTDSQQTTCYATAIINGEKRQVATATCNIRPGKSVSISVDALEDIATLPEADLAEITDMFASYLAGEITKAAALGVPVELPKVEA